MYAHIFFSFVTIHSAYALYPILGISVLHQIYSFIWHDVSQAGNPILF